MDEFPFFFDCLGFDLTGILHKKAKHCRTGVLIVVGGPQYRVGSHRMFVLLSRYLSDAGFAVMRFDYRGMGDSQGNIVTFEQIEPDIKAAIDAFFHRVPEMENIVLWGLCDAASACLMYAYKNPQISGLILLNPWIRTKDSMAETYIRHYYIKRFFSSEFRQKILSGKLDITTSLTSFTKMVFRAAKDLINKKFLRQKNESFMPFPEKMLSGMKQFKGKTLLIISGNDMTADEFKSKVNSSPEWEKTFCSERVTWKTLPESNHTFSQRKWRDKVFNITQKWIISKL